MINGYQLLGGSIASYKYYVDFDKVYNNCNDIKIELNVLNSLVGSNNIENDFEVLIQRYPEVLKCNPNFKFVWFTDGLGWMSVINNLKETFDVKNYLDKIGFKIINIVMWHKSDPPPLIYKNKFKFSYELIFWAKKDGKYTFNYDDMFSVAGEEMQDVWTIAAVGMSEKNLDIILHKSQKHYLKE